MSETPRTQGRVELLMIDAQHVQDDVASPNKLVIAAGMRAATRELRELETELSAALGRVEELEARVSFYDGEVPSIAHEYARAHLPKHGS